MPDTQITIHDVQVLMCTEEGEKLTTERDALDLIGEALQEGSKLVLIPMERLDENFFHLKTGLAGQIVQKFVTYRIRLVILGDISQYEAQSKSFKDFVYEANRCNQVWFITNIEELYKRLKPLC